MLPAVLARTPCETTQYTTAVVTGSCQENPACFLQHSLLPAWIPVPPHPLPHIPPLAPALPPSPMSDGNAHDAAGILYKPQHSTRRCFGAPQQLLLQQRLQRPSTDTQHVLGIAPMQRHGLRSAAAARTHCPGRLLHEAAAAETLSSLARTHCRLRLQPSSSKMTWRC